MKNTKENFSSQNFVRKADGSKILWELQSHPSGFWNSWRILGVDGCDKNSDKKIRWFCLSEKSELKWMKLILQYWLKKILLQPLKVRFFKFDSLEFCYQKEQLDFWHFLNASKLQIFRKIITYLDHRIQ